MVHRINRSCNSPSCNTPLDSAHHAPGGAWAQTISLLCRKNDEYKIPAAARDAGGQIEQSRPGKERPYHALILFFTCFFASPLARESGLYALLLAWLQVKGVALDLLDNVFLLHLALEAAQSVLEGLTLLKSNFCQTDTPPNPSGWTE